LSNTINFSGDDSLKISVKLEANILSNLFKYLTVVNIATACFGLAIVYLFREYHLAIILLNMFDIPCSNSIEWLICGFVGIISRLGIKGLMEAYLENLISKILDWYNDSVIYHAYGSDSASGSGTKTGSASGSGTNTGSASGSGTNTGSASGSGTNTGSASGSGTNTGADPDSESDSGTKTGGGPESDTDSEPDNS